MTNRFAETLRGLHPVTKTLSALLLIVAVVIVPSSGLVRLAWPAFALALLWLVAGLPIQPLLQRLGLAVPFIALAGTSALSSIRRAASRWLAGARLPSQMGASKLFGSPQ